MMNPDVCYHKHSPIWSALVHFSRHFVLAPYFNTCTFCVLAKYAANSLLLEVSVISDSGLFSLYHSVTVSCCQGLNEGSNKHSCF